MSCSCIISSATRPRIVSLDSMKVRVCGLVQSESRDSLAEAYRVIQSVFEWGHPLLDSLTSDAPPCTLAFRDPEFAGKSFVLVSLKDSSGIELSGYLYGQPNLLFRSSASLDIMQKDRLASRILRVNSSFKAYDGCDGFSGVASIPEKGIFTGYQIWEGWGEDGIFTLRLTGSYAATGWFCITNSSRIRDTSLRTAF